MVTVDGHVDGDGDGHGHPNLIATVRQLGYFAEL